MRESGCVLRVAGCGSLDLRICPPASPGSALGGRWRARIADFGLGIDRVRVSDAIRGCDIVYAITGSERYDLLKVISNISGVG